MIDIAKSSKIKPSQNLEKYSITLIFLYACMITYLGIHNKTFWYDEAYTISIIDYPINDIWNITSNDVHPPLYYILLKGFTIIFDKNIITLHIFSSLGVLASMVFGITKLKTIFGKKVAFTFILLLAIMPVSQYLGLEIRMYSWTMFFVLTASVYSFETIKSKKVKNYILFTISSIACAYTHNYGLLAVVVIYIYLIIFSFRNKEKRKYLFYSVFIFILMYSCWLPHILAQIQSVKKDFWIEPITPKDILLFSYYFFSPKEPSHPYIIFSKTTMSFILSIMLILLVTSGIIVFSIKDRKKNIANYFILIFIGTISISLIISYLFRPIIVARFTSCVLAPLLLGISININITWNKYKALQYAYKIMLLLLLTLTIMRFISENKYFTKKNIEYEKMKLFINNTPTSYEFIASEALYPELAKLSLIFPEKKFLLYSPIKTIQYLPFKIKIVNKIQKNGSYLWLSSTNNKYNLNDIDSLFTNKIEEEYITGNFIENSDVKIMQLRKNE